jgi:hypothetical protein
MTAGKRKKKSAAYWSDTIEVSRKMIAPGPHHEEHAVIYDLMHRARNREQLLPHYDRKTGEPIAQEANRLREEAQRRIEALPDGDLRRNLTRRNWDRA